MQQEETIKMLTNWSEISMEVIMTGERLTNNCKLYHDEKDQTKY